MISYSTLSFKPLLITLPLPYNKPCIISYSTLTLRHLPLQTQPSFLDFSHSHCLYLSLSPSLSLHWPLSLTLSFSLSFNHSLPKIFYHFVYNPLFYFIYLSLSLSLSLSLKINLLSSCTEPSVLNPY